MTIAEQVRSIVDDCLFTDKELLDPSIEKDVNGVPKTAVVVEGIVNTFCFHPDRLAKHWQGVNDVILQMPDSFHAGKGGGWSFLNLCMTRDGNQWGEQADAEILVCLAVGLGIGHYPMPREIWNILPGGMPYVVFDAA